MAKNLWKRAEYSIEDWKPCGKEDCKEGLPKMGRIYLKARGKTITEQDCKEKPWEATKQYPETVAPWKKLSINRKGPAQKQLPLGKNNPLIGKDQPLVKVA